MKSLKFKVIKNQNEAREIWDIFTPNKSIDDEWKFRHTFYKYLKFQLHFIVGFDEDKIVGLLPLQLNTNKGMSQMRFEARMPFLEFFGGIDTDDNKIFLLPGYEKYVSQFLKQLQSTAVLAPLAEAYELGGNKAIHYTDKFLTDIKEFTNLDMFIDANFQGKSRRRIKNRINHFNNNYKIEIKKGTETDLELLFQLNRDRFGEVSAFNMEHRKKIFRELSQIYDTDLFTIFMDGVPKAVSMSIIHKGVYGGLNSGYDYEVRDLGKFVFVTKIQRAIELGCEVFDAGKGDNGWKEHLHLNKIPQYKLAFEFPQVFAAATI